MEFRSAQNSDILKLSAWFHTKKEAQNWGGPLIRFPIELEQLKKDISFDIHASFALINNDELLGFIQVFDKYDYKHIGRVVINPSRRGEGLGLTLMEYLFEEYKECNKSYSLYVYKDNTKAKNLYEKLGFEICEDASTYGKNNDCFFMKK